MVIFGNQPDFGWNLRRYRQRKRISQKTLSSVVGISVYSIRGWEQGILQPRMDPEMLKGLCDALGVTPDALFARRPSAE